MSKRSDEWTMWGLAGLIIYIIMWDTFAKLFKRRKLRTISSDVWHLLENKYMAAFLYGLWGAATYHLFLDKPKKR
jgi:hypothetical protein